MVAELLGGAFNFKEDPPGPLQEGDSGFGEHGLAAEAVEQLVADLVLQVYNLLA